jgi:hypothetical protein
MAEQLPVLPKPFDQQFSCWIRLIDIGQQFKIVSERPWFYEIDVAGSAERANTATWRERWDDAFAETAITKAFGAATQGHRRSQAK